jgi:methionyl-tRNA formyltransferase
MKLEIKKTNDPILRQPAEDVISFDMELQEIVDNMIETMRANNGIGLAAPQVGISKKIIVCEFPGDEEAKIPPIPLTVVCNPKITSASKEICKMVEGCLSFPGMEILVDRPKEITIEGLDRYGKEIKISTKGLHSRVLQHENDHLNSILFIDHMKEVRTIFIGTGSLGVPALEALAVDPQYKIEMVITSHFEATSRTKNDNLIEEIAKKYNLPIIKTKNINSEDIVGKIKALKPELGIMADFGQIIKKDILDIPKYGIINIHPSLLPKHRGPSPVQQTILDGDKKTGVSLILTSEKMDAGAIISQASIKLLGSETSTILKDYLAKIGASILLNSVPFYITGDLKPIAQDENKATFSHLFHKTDGLIDQKTDPTEIERKVRAFDQWPKVYTIAKKMRIQIIATHFDKEGNFVIDRVKPEGKKEMSYEDFKRGYRVTLTFGQ